MPFEVGAPWAAALLITLFVLWLVARRSLLELPRWHRWLVGTIRVLLIVLLVAALLDLRKVSRSEAIALTFAVDVSGSVSRDQLAAVEAELRTIAPRLVEREVPVRTMVFDDSPRLLEEEGGLAAVLSDPMQPDPPEGQENPAGGDIPGSKGTDIEKALRFAYNLFPPGHTRRVALFTDGNETSGKALEAAAAAAREGIEVFTFSTRPPRTGETAVLSLDAPVETTQREKIKLQAFLEVLNETKARVELLRDGREIGSKEVDLGLGPNVITFKDTPPRPGLHRYTVKCVAEQDTRNENNQAETYVAVRPLPQVLVVEGGKALGPDGGGSAAGLLAKALRGGKWEIHRRPIEGFPRSRSELERYDAVVLSDVPPERLGSGISEGLKEYVRDFGGGLVFIGGEDCKNLGKKEEGEEKTPLETILPVNFIERKKKERIPSGMILLIDKSASMGRGEKFAMALRASQDVVDYIPEDTHIGILFFDDFPYWAFPLGPVKPRENPKSTLQGASVGGGTSMYPAIREACISIASTPLAIKHIVLLSDGESVGHFGSNADIIYWAAENMITISTVALGQDADQQVLKQIAELGGGNYYFTDDPNNIPKIFLKEAERITRTVVMERTFKPVLVKKGAMIRGIDLATAPDLTGYLSSRPRPTSETLVMTDEKEPLLTDWRYGLGRVVVYTSDVKGKWSYEWIRWPEFGRFWKGVVRSTLRVRDLEGLHVAARREGSVGRVEIDTVDRFGKYRNDLPLESILIRPDGRAEELAFDQRRPGGYAVAAELDSYGPYMVRVAASTETGNPLAAYAQIDRPYPAEYSRIRTNRVLLDAVAEITGGESDSRLDELLRPGRYKATDRQPLWPWFVFAAAGLFIVDVFGRRI